METGSKNEQRLIGARDLKNRLGVFLLQGLIVSMFLHSAIMAMIGLWPKDAVEPRFVITKPIPVLPTPVTPRPVVARPPKPTPPEKPDVKIFVPVDAPPADIDTLPEPPDENNFPDLHGKFDPNAIDSGGDFTEGAGSLGIDTANEAGFVPPFQPREIEPVRLSTNPQPEYPTMAQRAGVSGQVLVWVNISSRGDVIGWHVINVNPPGLGFEDAVANVIPKWRFTPAIQQNEPVAVWVAIPFRFAISH